MGVEVGVLLAPVICVDLQRPHVVNKATALAPVRVEQLGHSLIQRINGRLIRGPVTTFVSCADSQCGRQLGLAHVTGLAESPVPLFALVIGMLT